MKVILKVKRPALSSPMMAALFLIGLLIAGGVMGQLQQSGGPGSVVTVTSGTVTSNQGGTWTVQPGNTPNTTAWKVDGSAVTQPVSGAVNANQGGVWTVQPGNTPNTTAWKVDGSAVTQPVSGTMTTVPKTACGTALASGSTLAAMPTVSTLLTSAATACVVSIFFSNTNASAGTVTLTDNTGTPINAALTFSIPANSNLILPLNGVAFNLGVKWTASATGFTGAVVAYQ